MAKHLEAAREAGRAYGASVPVGPNRADHIAQVAWSYACNVGRNVDRRAIAEAYAAAAEGRTP